MFIKEADSARSIICFPPWKCALSAVTRVWRPIFTAFIIVVNVNRHCRHGNLFSKRQFHRLSMKSQTKFFLFGGLVKYRRADIFLVSSFFIGRGGGKKINFPNGNRRGWHSVEKSTSLSGRRSAAFNYICNRPTRLRLHPMYRPSSFINFQPKMLLYILIREKTPLRHHYRLSSSKWSYGSGTRREIPIYETPYNFVNLIS